MQTMLNPVDDLGVVYKKTLGNYLVQTGERSLSCRLSPRLEKSLSGIAPAANRRANSWLAAETLDDPVVVGDRVRFSETPEGDGQIIAVLPRRNRLARRSAVPMPSARPHEQVIAANLDQILPVFAAAEPSPKWNLLDRYLVSAEALELPAVICITKIDLVSGPGGRLPAELGESMEEYRKIGYPLLQVSTVTGQGLDELRQLLQGRISVLVGKSGVGKTSLLNALQPGLGLKVREVSRIQGKGKHTTSHQEMFPLDFGGALIDTPGIREFGVWDVTADELAWLFPEMRPFLGRCRFRLDCRHDDEPGCALRKAVTAGLVSPRRYQSYMRLKEEL